MTLDDLKMERNFGHRVLPDGRVLIVYPLTYGRARLTVSSVESFKNDLIDDSW
jgi:hypothetical protein